MMKEIHGGNIYKFDHKVYDFSANLNPLGMPEEVKQAIISNIDAYESYPDPFNRELTAAISSFHGVEEGRICCGNGAADVIFRIPLALKPEKALLVSPTFSEYQQALETVGCRVHHHFLTEEKEFIPDDSILESVDSSYDMMFLCNPNNPTGIPAGRELVLAIAEKCRKCGIVLVIDECFSEFLDEEEKYSVMDCIKDLSNVIILKAFTKIYAMAGLRLGYCICGDYETADKIRGTLQPWTVSPVASKAGTAALQLEGFVEKTKEYVRENREFLVNGLQNLGYRVYNTRANYIFFKGSEHLSASLEAYDIMIRSCSNYISLDKHYYRIAVRTREENEYFLKSLEKVSKQAAERKEDMNNG